MSYWVDYYRRVLMEGVREPFRDEKLINEFLEFLGKLFDRWWHGDPSLRGKYAYNVAILRANSKNNIVIRAKLNAYYAYLVHMGYVTAYMLMRDKYVAGGESLYTWLRMYRAYGMPNQSP